MWPFKRRPKGKLPGSQMRQHGVLECSCGAKVPVVLSCYLPSVDISRFNGMRAPTITLEGIPCHKCDRSHSATMHPGQYR